MNEEEKEDIELDIEAKYVDKTEKEFLSRVTYAECLYILTPENKYCDKIKELSVLKLCEIIDKLQKENETLKNKLLDTLEGQKVIKEETPQYIKENYILKEKAKDKIEKLNDESHAEELEDIMIGKNYTITELVQYVLQELIEESEEK